MPSCQFKEESLYLLKLNTDTLFFKLFLFLIKIALVLLSYIPTERQILLFWGKIFINIFNH